MTCFRGFCAVSPPLGPARPSPTSLCARQFCQSPEGPFPHTQVSGEVWGRAQLWKSDGKAAAGTLVQWKTGVAAQGWATGWSLGSDTWCLRPRVPRKCHCQQWHGCHGPVGSGGQGRCVSGPWKAQVILGSWGSLGKWRSLGVPRRKPGLGVNRGCFRRCRGAWEVTCSREVPSPRTKPQNLTVDSAGGLARPA